MDSSKAESPGMMGGGMMGGGMMDGPNMHALCPAAVPGTTTQAEDVEGGAALTFKTTGDVAELRRRLARMVDMHNQHHVTAEGTNAPQSGMMSGMMMSGMMMSGMMMGGMMPDSQARAEDTEGGGRLIFTPRKPEDLQALRDKVKQAAADMSSHRCPMMKHDKAVAEQNGR